MHMLTPRQKQIFDFINSYQKKHGYAPSIPEIAKRLKRAISTVHEHIASLENKGYINKLKNRARSMDPVRGIEMVRVPLLGVIAAGEPIHVFGEDREHIAVPQKSIPANKNVFALRVEGNSMIDENIHDGDTILVQKQETAENGQKVVALIDGNQATLKKFYQEKGQIRLQPANKSMQPFIFPGGRGVAVQGVLLDVVRNGNPPTVVDVAATTSARGKSADPEIYFEQPSVRLYHGDSLRVLEALPENSIDMIFADPPYNLSNGGFSVHAGRMVSVNKGEWDKSRGFQDDYEFHYRWLAACKRVLKPEGTLWVSGTYHSIYQCGHALQSLGYHILNDVAWFKPNASPNLSCRFFTASHETLIWARKDKKAKHVFNYQAMKEGNWSGDFIKKPGLQMRSVWAIGTPKPAEKVFGKHPTQKPLDLLHRIVLASTKKGDIILDPFTGSSTTGLSAVKHGRKFIGIDMDKNYLDLSIKRLKELEK